MVSVEISGGRGMERWSKCIVINGATSICTYVETARLVILSWLALARFQGRLFITVVLREPNVWRDRSPSQC